MVMEYIPIDSIDEIDPSKVSIRDLNKKYIDRDGNRYAIRFDLTNRRVEIVRLARTIEEARKIQMDIRSGKISARPGKSSLQNEKSMSEDLSSDPQSLSTDEFYSSDSTGFSSATDDFHEPGMVAETEISESELFEEIIYELGKIQESQTAVLNGLKKSRVFESGDDSITEIQRKVDLESTKPIDEALNYYKELTSYPRAVSHYMTKLSRPQKQYLETIKDEDLLLAWVKKFQLEDTFRSALKSVSLIVDYLRSRISAITDSELAALPATQTIPFRDVTPSLDMITQRADSCMHKLKTWKATEFPHEVQ